MKKLISKTLKSNKELFKKHNRVLLAVSTGIDSMVLLKYFEELKEVFNIKELAVAHVNHGLRDQSNEEEKFIKDYCEVNNIPIHVAHFTSHSEFSENLAREFRYKFFKELMKEYNYSAIVTAHHKDDQAETIFMKLVRGSRLFDLQGIKTVQPFGNGELIRPFLSVRKGELPNVFHYEDETNSGNDYFRNRVRNIYIPDLEKENSGLTNHLVNLGKEISSLNSALTEFISKVDYLNIKTFRSYSKDIQTYFVQDYINNLRTEGKEFNISKGTMEDVLNMLNKGKQYNQKLNDNLTIVITKENWALK